MKTKAYAAIIPAAGFSSRMKRFKPLLKIGDQTITDCLINLFLENQVEVVLVVGWQKDQLLGGIESRNIRIVENPDFNQGMFSSIKAGLRFIQAGGYQAVFIHPVDIPLVRPYTISRLLAAAAQNPGRIIYPLCSEKRGHPTLLPAGLVRPVLDWQNEGGLKAALEKQRDLAVEIKVPDDYIHFDVDTSDDYQALLECYQTYEVPSPGEFEVINDICNVEAERRRHCLRVSVIAVTVGEALIRAGRKVDLPLVHAAAILHDLAKGQKDHAGTGGRILHEMGFGKTGKVVAAHSDLPDGTAASSLEAKIVFLADKFVSGENPVSVEKRYEQALERFGADDKIKAEIIGRREVALNVKQEFELVLGYPLEKIIP